MSELLWDKICSRLRPCEVAEVEYIIGSELIERNQEVFEEIHNLLVLQGDIKPMPNIFRYAEKVNFYLNQLIIKSGGTPHFSTREQRIVDNLSDGYSTRPQSAQTPFRVELNLPSQLDVFLIEELKDSLKEALDEEYELLIAQASELQNSLVYQVSEPTPNEVKMFAKKLEQAYLHDPVFPKVEAVKKLEPIVREEPDFEFELTIKKPLDICVPKIKTVTKPLIKPKLDTDDMAQTQRPPTTGKVSRRLRNLVDDFRMHNV